MIIPLKEAQEIDIAVTDDDLAAFEQTVRTLTNNKFQNTKVRYNGISFLDESSLQAKEPIVGFRPGDTVEVSYSPYNSGLYHVEEVDGDRLKVSGTPFLAVRNSEAMITLVQYPADIKRGVKKLLEYDVKMRNKVGIKSESISRMSVTYYDVNAADNAEGYPASLLSFLKKHTKMRW